MNMTTKINYEDLENLISEVVTNTIYKTQENFDLVIRQFFKFDIVGFKTKFLQNLVIQEIPEDMRFLYDIKNINYRINKFIKNSRVVTRDDNNTVVKKHFSESFEELVKSVKNFRKYLFEKELEKIRQQNKRKTTKQKKMSEKEQRKRELDKFYEKKLQEIYDKNRQRYFTMFSYVELHEERKQHILDYDDIDETEIDKYIIDVMRNTLYDNPNKINYDIHFEILKKFVIKARKEHYNKEQRKRTVKKTVKKKKTINPHELLKKLRNYCSKT